MPAGTRVVVTALMAGTATKTPVVVTAGMVVGTPVVGMVARPLMAGTAAKTPVVVTRAPTAGTLVAAVTPMAGRAAGTPVVAVIPMVERAAGVPVVTRAVAWVRGLPETARTGR